MLNAELLARNGDYDTASSFINDVRNRAGLDKAELNSSNFITLISKERRVELFAEGKRWYDAKCLDILEEVVENKNFIFKCEWTNLANTSSRD
ncbi:RagB/SusD family nutrient uptake outer membrane protein [Zunongwangia sp. HGR-M22]|uniref:RagB/SusD family nutrient uptake outer membrane protein n=1 Tax=Zunongwangia sp. HGR-M22 TaxID=3015168 RepID=UPI0022DE01F0|nr:RagB/SusD family nutrient uptake outer membrane protein [Zunongwangia sp. HGR-M22]WBL26126.1 RagB/SusD family nutrient uptake outer membrane protein [Zunongwangia sp. HGR-M22]